MGTALTGSINCWQATNVSWCMFVGCHRPIWTAVVPLGWWNAPTVLICCLQSCSILVFCRHIFCVHFAPCSSIESQKWMQSSVSLYFRQEFDVSQMKIPLFSFQFPSLFFPFRLSCFERKDCFHQKVKEFLKSKKIPQNLFELIFKVS